MRKSIGSLESEQIEENIDPSTSKFTFGPPGFEWTYAPSDKTYDLTRGVSTCLTLKATRGSEGTSIKFAPEMSALVVIDCQNLFLDPSCNHHPDGLAAVPSILAVVQKCREIGVKVFPSGGSQWLVWIQCVLINLSIHRSSG